MKNVIQMNKSFIQTLKKNFNFNENIKWILIQNKDYNSKVLK